MSFALINPKQKTTTAGRPAPFTTWQAHPWLEPLEDRVLLSLAGAIPLTFTNVTAVSQTAHAASGLENPTDVRLYELTLNAGDLVTASVNTSPYGGGLDSYLRIFQDLGGGVVQEIAANDNFQASDPGVTFEAAGAGSVVYYVGISRFDNTGYDPAVPPGGAATSLGLFDLNLRKIPAPAAVLLQAEVAVEDDSNATRAAAQPIALNSHTQDLAILSGDRDFFKIVLNAQGNLYAQLDAGGSPISLTLYDDAGRVIVRSDGATSAADPAIRHTLPGAADGTTYYLKVENLGVGAGHYRLTTQFTPTDSVLQNVILTTSSVAIVTGDFNRDGIADLATGNWNNNDFTAANNVTVLLGNGDGTFQNAGSFPLDTPPHALVTADFDGDDILDLAGVAPGTNGVRILLGNGDGTFQDFIAIIGPGGDTLVAADFNGDDRADLAVGVSSLDQIHVLTSFDVDEFETLTQIDASDVLSGLAAGFFNDDNLIDIAAADQFANSVTVFINQGDDTFLANAALTVETPLALTLGDLDGDQDLDLVAVSSQASLATVLLNDGDGLFVFGNTFAVGDHPNAIISADFDSDGLLDVATADYFGNGISVALGNGDGTFASPHIAGVGANPAALLAGDFDGDGNADVAAVNYYSRSVSVLLGHGDGTFPQNTTQNNTGQSPVALVQGDFNGDGRDDIASANRGSNDVTILLGQGDGTFENVGRFAVGADPEFLVAGDFNGDGRLDLATANYGYGSNSVSVLLGNGNGTFQNAVAFAVDGNPAGLAVGDFDNDNDLDLAVGIAFDLLGDGTKINILLNDGQGVFTSGVPADVGTRPRAVVAGDFNGDFNLDLAVANYGSNDVTVLLGDGHGHFTQGDPIAVGGFPLDLVTGDFDGDLDLDLAVVLYSSTVKVFMNHGAATFEEAAFINVGASIQGLIAGDFDNNGDLDLVTANWFYTYTYLPANNISVFLGDGAWTFTPGGVFAAGNAPFGLALGDFNADDQLDLAAANLGTSLVTALLGTGAGTFITPSWAARPVQSTPLLARLIGSPVNDAVVLTETGRILFRRGLEDQPGAFAPPVVLNLDPNEAARDLALVKTKTGFLLAALNAHTFTVTLYQPRTDGTFVTLAGPALQDGYLPANIASANLDNDADGLADLVISAAASDQVFVALQTAPGVFGEALPYTVGANPSALELVDVNGDNFRDLVVTSRFSGQVSVLLNLGDGTFSDEERFRAGTDLYGLGPFTAGLSVKSLEETNGIVSGEFDGHSGADLVALNGGTLGFSFLAGNGLGGFLNPNDDQTVYVGSMPIGIAAADFTDDGNLDVAVLSADSGAVSIYGGDGFGNFTFLFSSGAGSVPTGITAADVSRPGGGGPDGFQDLLVGNAFGDLLILIGNGDGTFLQYRRGEQGVSLAISESGETGERTFFFSNEGTDQLAFQTADAGEERIDDATVFQERSEGIEAPGPQTIVEVLGVQYLVVANSGGNEVLLYTITPEGAPDAASKQTYFTGTDPTALTVTDLSNDLNGDQVPDLVVANQGSNDVSVFLGKLVGGVWTLTYRPRQDSAGIGPSAIAIADVTGADGVGAPDGIADVIVSNAQSNQVSVLPNRGSGFLINQPPAVDFSLFTGIAPRLMFVGNFDGDEMLDLATVNALSNDVTLIRNFAVAPITTTIDSGGLFPGAAVVRDFNRDGIMDILVANIDSGILEFFAGGPSGFESAGSFSLAQVPQLSDLAVVAAGDGFDIYASLASQEAAILVATFGPPGPGPATLPPSPGFPFGLDLTATPPTVNADPAFIVAVDKTVEQKNEDDANEIDDSTQTGDVAVANGTYGSTDSGLLAEEERGRSVGPNIPRPRLGNPPPPDEEEEESEPSSSQDDVKDAGPLEFDPGVLVETEVAGEEVYPMIALDEGSAGPRGVRGPGSFERLVVEMEPQERNPDVVEADAPAESAKVYLSSASVVVGLWFALPALAARLRDAYGRLRVKVRKVLSI